MYRALCRSTLVAAISVLLSACASGYKEFYRPNPNVSASTIASLRVAPPPIYPSIERASPGDSRAIVDAYAKRGFLVIGNSLFSSGRPESDESAVRQGQAIGADLVLILNPRYAGSTTTSMPIVTPSTTTSHSTATATAFGPGGPVTAYGTGTTTTYGTTTNYVPFTIHRSDFGAVYFIKQAFGFGTFNRDLNDAERQEHQTNKGAVVRLVVDGTPAFNADVLVGDIVTTIDAVAISNAREFSQLLLERRGKRVTLSIIRRGQKLEKTIQLNL